MLIHQFYTHCLAEASYILISEGEAAVVDPIRDIDIYLNYLKENNATLKYVLETHFHADFISGHLELAKATGAKIVYGPTAEAEYEIHVAQNHEKLQVGNAQIEVLHTPGHTPESVCYLVWEDEKAQSIFTGDTLFVGDVGRPDLLEGLIASTNDQMENLYQSIQNVIKKLPKDLVVYPAHGPGSMCGKSIGTDTQTTIEKELANNYALQNLDKKAFSEAVLSDQLPAPWYFQQNALKNRKISQQLEQIMDDSSQDLNAKQTADFMANHGLVLDVRNADDFAKGHIPGSINIGLNGSLAIWLGTLIHNLQQPIVLITPKGEESTTIVRLARVGFENVLGFLKGGIEAWRDAGFSIETTEEQSAIEFAEHIDSLKGVILDVRGKGERETGYLPDSQGIPLRDFPEQAQNLDKEKTYFIHCAGGYRSMIAASWLQKLGFQHVVNVKGGYNEIKKHLQPA